MAESADYSPGKGESLNDLHPRVPQMRIGEQAGCGRKKGSRGPVNPKKGQYALWRFVQ
jgi:hypothetical protein